jgi:MYND finger
MEKEEKEEDLTNNIPRLCMPCDGPNCEKKRDATNRCGRCRLRYYCSVICQKADWKQEHKHDCIDWNEMKEKHEASVVSKNDSSSPEKVQSIGMDEEDNTTVMNTEDHECPICLSSPIRQPLVLPDCKHTFCSSCTCASKHKNLSPTVT